MSLTQFEIQNGRFLDEGLPIVLDVEGGDHHPSLGISPDHLVDGARIAKLKGVNVLLVGLEQNVAGIDLPYIVVNEVVPMGTDDKISAIRNANTSVNIAAKLVKDGVASGFASPCDTAAMIGASSLVLGRHGRIKTPLIADIPRNLKVGGNTYLLDVGAFPEDVDAFDLARYGIMGALFASSLSLDNVPPTVGILSNGSEKAKGTRLVKNAWAILSEFDGNFTLLDGFVEGRDLFGGEVDVVVTDGFSGNLVLKTAEGTAMATLQSLPTKMRQNGKPEEFVDEVKQDIFSLASIFDPNEVGGAPVLGVKGNAIVMHGNSNALAATRALQRLKRLAAADFQPQLAADLARFKEFVGIEKLAFPR